MEFRILDVEHVVEHRVEFVLERADDALERHHLLADDHDPGPDHAGVVAARARRDAAAHRTVEWRVVQYERAADAARDERGHRHEVQAQPVHRGTTDGGMSGCCPLSATPWLRLVRALFGLRCELACSAGEGNRRQ